MPRPPLNRENSLGYQANHLARLLAHVLRDRIEPLGVVPGQFVQLLALYECDGLTQTELCSRVQIEQPTMARTLARMERDGLIKRVSDPDDRRRSLVMVTPLARELEDELLSAATSVNALATRGLDKREVAAFMATMTKVIDNLEASKAVSNRLTDDDQQPSR
jgi:DNA-binding MarR family transcriptional regulator